MMTGIGSLDKSKNIRNKENYEKRIKNVLEKSESRTTSKANMQIIFKFLNTKLSVLKKDPEISCIKDENDKNREILSRLHEDISITDFKNLGLEQEPRNKNNVSIVSEVLSELGIEKISKVSLFKNELATAKISALEDELKKYGTYRELIVVKAENIKNFTRVTPDFPKLSNEILNKKFNVNFNFHRGENNKNEYYVQLNTRLGFAHNRGTIVYIDDKNKTATLLCNSQSSSITSFKLNEETNQDAKGLYTDLTKEKYKIKCQFTNEQDSVQMKHDLGVYTDINPLEQQCPNSCGTTAQRFIIYRYLKDNNMLDELNEQQRRALSNDISFWQYVHGDCDSIDKFKTMAKDPNFQLNSQGERKGS